jgi:hypothetical protein
MASTLMVITVSIQINNWGCNFAICYIDRGDDLVEEHMNRCKPNYPYP